jgi:hypothetical protein
LGFTLPVNGALVAAIAYAGSVVAEGLYVQLAAARAQGRLFSD